MSRFFARATTVRRLAVLAALVSVACTRPMATATAYKALPPKASADAVEVFTDVRPERAHEELGVIDVKSSPLSVKADYGKPILDARQRAAQMGADAIIVTRRPATSTTTVGNATRRKGNKGTTYTENATTSDTARISVVAIAWKARQ